MLESYKSKYSYGDYEVLRKNGIRYYQINADLLVPSVTSILIATRPNFLTIPKKIKNEQTNSVEIGNLMHKYLDHYVSQETDFFDENKNFQIAKNLAKIIIDNCLKDIDEIWGTEVSVCYKEKYAGTIDLIGIMNGKLIIIDYKSSYRKKTIDELDEYFLQLAAYTLAHDWQHGTKTDSIMIFLCMRNGTHEKRVVSSSELVFYQQKWLERLTMFEKLRQNNE